MKHYIIFLLAAIFLSCKTEKQEKTGYTINVSAPGIYNGIRAYLKTTDEQGKLVNKDTAIVMDGRFAFEGFRKVPTFEYLFIDGQNGYLPIIVENGDIAIQIEKDSIYTSKILGNTSNTDFYEFRLEEKKLKEKMTRLTNLFTQATINNSPEKEALYKNMNETKEALSNLPFKYIDQNEDSYLTLILIGNALGNNAIAFEKIESHYNKLSEPIKSTPFGNQVGNYLEMKRQQLIVEQATKIGNMAPNFSAQTPDGKLLSLNDIKGKVTIIDFWASWCGPCRRENPHVVETFKNYHGKGLEIISVSLDNEGQKDKWIKAIEDDNMTWHHVSNLKSWQDPIAKLYGVQSIPATFILDENGKIVAKNLRGAELGAKMAELLN